MAQRPIVIQSLKASATPSVAGAELAKEFATQAFPESRDKRQWFNMYTPNKAVTAGATATELFIDGMPNFRFVMANKSTVALKLLASYTSDVAANNTGFELFVVGANLGGSVELRGAAVINKLASASTATITVGVDQATQALTFTAAGVAGDTNGRWNLRCIGISEVTDLG